MGEEGGQGQTPEYTPKVRSLPQHIKTRKGESNFGQDQHEGSWVTYNLAYHVSTLLGWKDPPQNHNR